MRMSTCISRYPRYRAVSSKLSKFLRLECQKGSNLDHLPGASFPAYGCCGRQLVSNRRTVYFPMSREWFSFGYSNGLEASIDACTITPHKFARSNIYPPHTESRLNPIIICRPDTPTMESCYRFTDIQNKHILHVW